LQISFRRLPSWTTADGAAENAPAVSFAPSRVNSVISAQIAHNVKSANVLREEKLEANGKAVPCYLVDVLQSADAGPEHRTVWIDKATFLVLRIAFRTAELAKDSQPALPFDWVITFTSYQLNEPPPDWLVEIGQKAEKELATLTARMIGMQAPVFKLQDLDGREVSLDNLHGKAVLLSFWATWCGSLPKRTAVAGQA
jgi:hypothetical protein